MPGRRCRYRKRFSTALHPSRGSTRRADQFFCAGSRNGCRHPSLTLSVSSGSWPCRWVGSTGSPEQSPRRIQRRLFQMGEYLGGIPLTSGSAIWGIPWVLRALELEDYPTDFQVWVPPDTGSLGVEAASLHGVITLCIENKAPAEASLRHPHCTGAPRRAGAGSCGAGLNVPGDSVFKTALYSVYDWLGEDPPANFCRIPPPCSRFR